MVGFLVKRGSASGPFGLLQCSVLSAPSFFYTFPVLHHTSQFFLRAEYANEHEFFSREKLKKAHICSDGMLYQLKSEIKLIRVF
jgi:hypothetical protein